MNSYLCIAHIVVSYYLATRNSFSNWLETLRKFVIISKILPLEFIVFQYVWQDVDVEPGYKVFWYLTQMLVITR